jgi:hypothetical protein
MGADIRPSTANVKLIGLLVSVQARKADVRCRSHVSRLNGGELNAFEPARPDQVRVSLGMRASSECYFAILHSKKATVLKSRCHSFSSA